jgi:hypothetical protein
LSHKSDSIMLYVGMPPVILSLVLWLVVNSTHAISCSLGVFYFYLGSQIKLFGVSKWLQPCNDWSRLQENQKFHKLSLKKTITFLKDNSWSDLHVKLKFINLNLERLFLV